MRRALISACAVFGLMLGYCSQPREIRAADSQLRLGQKIKDDFKAGFGDGQAALADGHSRLGEQGKSRAELERIAKELPGTEYAKRAGAGMGDPTDRVKQRTRMGCHQGAR